MSQPPLRPLHSESLLSPAKIAEMRRWTTDRLVDSLAPGRDSALKARQDGTMLDGHHRVFVLLERGYDVHSLPREVITAGP